METVTVSGIAHEEAAVIAETVAAKIEDVITVAVEEATEEDGTEWLEERLRAQENSHQEMRAELRSQNQQLTELVSRLLEAVTRMAESMTGSALATAVVATAAADSSDPETSAVVVTVDPETVPEPANVVDPPEAKTVEAPRRRHRRI